MCHATLSLGNKWKKKKENAASKIKSTKSSSLNEFSTAGPAKPQSLFQLEHTLFNAYFHPVNCMLLLQDACTKLVRHRYLYWPRRPAAPPNVF